MSARRAGAVDEATGSTANAEGGNQGKQPQSGSLLGSVDELLETARESGHVIGEPTRTKQESQESEESDEEVEEQVSDESEEDQIEGSEEEQETEEEEESESEEEGRAEGEAESEEEEEEESEEEGAGERKSIDQQIKDLKAAGKPVPWYFSRISKLTRQRTERDTQLANVTAQARALYAENQSLKQNGAGGATQDTTDPLGQCFTEQDLQGKAREAEKWLAWCERNRNGGEAKVGDKTVELDPDQVIDLKLGCEKTLREGIPQRRQYIADRMKMDAKAVEIYPEYRDPSSAFRQEADDMLRVFPILQKLPDVRIWIGHAIAGRNAYLAKLNGKQKQSSQSKIVKSAKTRVAPTTAKTRGFSPRSSSVDKESAKKDLQQKGDSTSAEKYLETLGIGGGRSKKFERVEA